MAATLLSALFCALFYLNISKWCDLASSCSDQMHDGIIFLMRYNWHRTVSLRYTTCWFDTYCNMMTTISLTNISILSRNCHFFFVMGTFAIWSLNNLEVCDAVLLTIITVLYIKSPQLLHLLVTSLCPWTTSPQLPLFSAPGDHSVSTLCLWISLSEIPHISDDMHYLSFFVWLIWLGNALKLHPCCCTGRILFFLMAE